MLDNFLILKTINVLRYQKNINFQVIPCLKLTFTFLVVCLFQCYPMQIVNLKLKIMFP